MRIHTTIETIVAAITRAAIEARSAVAVRIGVDSRYLEGHLPGQTLRRRLGQPRMWLCQSLQPQAQKPLATCSVTAGHGASANAAAGNSGNLLPGGRKWRHWPLFFLGQGPKVSLASAITG